MIVKLLSFLSIAVLCISSTEVHGQRRPPRDNTSGPNVTCTFEDDLCDWVAVDNAFKLASAKTINVPENIKLDTPFDDHTEGTADGQFAYFANGKDTPQEAVLRHANPFKGKSVCVHFAYHLSAATTATVFTFTTDYHKPSTLFKVFGSNNILWQMARFTVANSNADNFYFYTKLSEGALAIDDVIISLGECPVLDQVYDFEYADTMECTFEHNSSCIFKPLPGHQEPNHWRMYKASQFAHFADHTTHRADGHFYGIDLSETVHNTANTLTLTSRQFRLRYGCIRFSYFTANLTTGFGLSVYVTTTGHKKTARQRAFFSGEDTDGAWYQREYQFVTGQSYVIQFEVEDKNGARPFQGMAFIDDVKIFTDRCIHWPEKCEFEEGDLCLMERAARTFDNLPGETKKEMTSVAVGKTVAKNFVLRGIDLLWRAYTPRQNVSAFIDIDHTFKKSKSTYLVLHGNAPYGRGIFMTEQFPLLRGSLAMEPRTFVCLSIAVVKPSKDSVLEIYQVEPQLPGQARKVWAISEQVYPQWTVINLKVAAHAGSNQLAFYFVGTLIDPNTYLGIDDIVSIRPGCPRAVNV